MICHVFRCSSLLTNSIQKYGHVAFDSTQKAVLTSCVLRYKPRFDTGFADTSTDHNASTTSTTASEAMHMDRQDSEEVAGDEKEQEAAKAVALPREEKFVNCCFSFTIRRDKWGIPSMIVGNFIAT